MRLKIKNDLIVIQKRKYLLFWTTIQEVIGAHHKRKKWVDATQDKTFTKIYDALEYIEMLKEENV